MLTAIIVLGFLIVALGITIFVGKMIALGAEDE